MCRPCAQCFFFIPPSSTSKIITEPLYHPHPTFCGSQPQSMIFFFFFFISQHGEFETQPTQTTFTVWQMKLINNLKHALTVAHTIMSLNVFLPAREMHLNHSPVMHMKGRDKHNNLCCFFFISQCYNIIFYSTTHALTSL